ncbi:baseplate J/gp47 family protein [Pseudomonas anatoliensis]|uniref:baseplate assembly protein n=1 Tax=Pseudomonas anatoliensis TaxID=2710589 RepID=UPI001B34279B|nr:baseplate J/gp47 family protein [Pseudomonas anatoliensis]MBP5958126.1 baseplate J/gp47 family protein [Pseudomonas anatoliensis]
MHQLPKPEFIKIDPAALEAELIARYEKRSGKTLYPAQIERLYIDQIAYAVSRLQMSIQHAGEQLLVRFARGSILDYLGELVATPRLLAKAARCTLRFSLPTITTRPVLIPIGTPVSTQDAKLIFITDRDATLAANQTQVTVTATCLTAGEQGNGWTAGQISVLGNPPAIGLTASNTTSTADGAADEDDDRYRERIILAPEAFSNAGSRAAYRYHALAVHQSIIDVAVHGPDEGQPDGHVALYPLTAEGLPTPQLLQDITRQISGEKLRPLCDTVHAIAPIEVSYAINANLTFYETADRNATMAAAHAAANTYAQECSATLGRDLVPEQLTAALQVPGVYRADLQMPLDSRELSGNEWAHCTEIKLIDAGVAHG